jgi:hypothetical protein
MENFTMLRTALALIIVSHGVGHILFLVPLLGIADWGQSTRSWLFTGETGAQIVGSVLWICATIAFCVAAYGLVSQLDWWRNVAIAACVISALGIAMFWINPASSSAVFALAFNIAAFGALVVAHWPNVEAVGA